MSAASWRQLYQGRPVPEYERDPYWNRMVLACKWAIRLLTATFAVGVPVALLHGLTGALVMAVLGAAFVVPFVALFALSLHGFARAALRRLPGPFTDWNNAAWARGFRLAWRRRSRG